MAITPEPPRTDEGIAVVVEPTSSAGERWFVITLVSDDVDDAAGVLSRIRRYALGAPHLEVPELREAGPGISLAHRVRGESVAELMARGELSAERIANWVERAGEALGFLHDQGVAHGHVRAELIWGEGTLGGFGVAQLVLEQGGAAAAVEALPSKYRPPEPQGPHARLETWADVYALGVIVAERLGGAFSLEVDNLLAQATAGSPSVRPLAVRDWTRELASALRKRVAVDSFQRGSDQPEEVRPVTPLAPNHDAASVTPPHTSETPVDQRKPCDELKPRSRDHRAALDQIADHPAVPPPPPSSRGQGVAPPTPSRGQLTTGLFVGGGLLLLFAGVVVIFALALRTVTPATGGSPIESGGAGGAGGAWGMNTAPLAPSPITRPVPSAVPSSVPGPSGSSSLSYVPPRASDTPPEHARAAIPIDENTPALGPPMAPVTIVLFADLASFESLRAFRRLRPILQRSEVRLIWRHQPADDHTSLPVSTGVGLHLDHGDRAFFDYVRSLAKQPDVRDEEQLGFLVASHGARATDVRRWQASPDVAKRLEADRALSVLFNVRVTPTAFVNGIRLEGKQGMANLAEHVADERRAAFTLLADGLRPEEIYPARVLRNLVAVGPEVNLRTCPHVDDAPWRGSPEPLVTIVEFGDFECEYCARAQPVVRRLLEELGDDGKLVWKDFPIRQHRHAHAAAALGRAAFSTGGSDVFWRLHRELFASTNPLEETELRRLGKLVGIDEVAIDGALRTGAYDAAINAELREVAELGVVGIPTYFVNGVRVDGLKSEAKLRALVLGERTKAQRLLDAGLSRRDIYQALCF